jgi:HAMP domain-containing protein
MNKSETGGGTKSRRSRVLWEITALVVVVYVISGVAAFFISMGSYNRLAKESTDKLINEKAQTISSSYDYLATAEMQVILSTYGKENIVENEFLGKVMKQDRDDIHPLQAFVSGEFQKMKDSGLLGLEYIFMVMTIPLTGEQVNFISNDRSRFYTELPGSINQAVENGDSWILVEEGFPALGLEGAQLVTFTQVLAPVETETWLTFIGITPMQDDIDQINSFYDQEKKNTMISYALVTMISLVIIIVVTFFVLRYLIRKRITEPIDVLSGEAEEIMEGNLDVEIAVHKGGEFEGLEQAFREMVVSFRNFIEKSTGG